MADNESLAESEELDFADDEEGESHRNQLDKDKRTLAIQLARTPEQDDTFRPLLADAQKIGFFSLDRACQTNVTEIVEIKELTDTVEQLLEDSATMRRDINFARSVMQAEFDAKLQKKALELYERVNEKIGEIERMHEERVGTVRRAFRQQLADALVRVKSLYNNNMEQKMRKERKRKDQDVGKWEQKIKELQSTIQRNESIIHMLKMQLSQYQEKEEEIISYKSSNKTPSVNLAEQELDEMKEEYSKLEKQVDRLQEALDIKEKDNEDLLKDMEELNQQLEKERIQVEQLHQEKANMQENKEAEEQATKKFDQAMEQQRIAFEKELNERILQVREQTLEDAKKETASLQSGDAKIIKGLQDEKRMLEQQLAKERTKKQVKSKEQLDLEKARGKEQAMLDEIAKLKREIDRVHRTWEKKFAILQQSLHALKDESYLRQTMQKQAAQLHQASISYAADTPMGVMPTKAAPPPLSPKKPLPHIQNKGQKPTSPADYLSYTVSAPSGRATTLFSTDENQIMSDGEQDLPDDIVPLPPPPPDRDDSRASARSHVVVLPHA